MRLIAVLGVLFVLASCSDSDTESKYTEYKCGSSSIYYLKLSADKQYVLRIKEFKPEYGGTLTQKYYFDNGNNELIEYRNHYGEYLYLRLPEESFENCEQT